MHSDATLVFNMLEVAESLDQLAASTDCRGALAWRLGENADKARATAVELARRRDAAIAMIELERENLQLKAKLQKTEQEVVKLRLRQHGTRNKERGSHAKLPRAAPRAKPRIVTGKSVDSSTKEMRALAEQFQALGETEPAIRREDRPTGLDESARPVLTDTKMKVPPEVRSTNSRAERIGSEG